MKGGVYSTSFDEIEMFAYLALSLIENWIEINVSNVWNVKYVWHICCRVYSVWVQNSKVDIQASQIDQFEMNQISQLKQAPWMELYNDTSQKGMICEIWCPTPLQLNP